MEEGSIFHQYGDDIGSSKSKPENRLFGEFTEKHILQKKETFFQNKIAKLV